MARSELGRSEIHVTDDREADLGKAFDRATMIVGACSAAFLAFDKYIPVDDLFNVPSHIADDNNGITRLVWIIAALTMMYFTKLYRTRSYRQTIRLAWLFCAFSIFGLSCSAFISGNYVISYDVDHRDGHADAHIIVRPVTLDPDVISVSGIESDHGIQMQNDRLRQTLAQGATNGEIVRNNLDGNNMIMEFIYRSTLFIGTAFVFVAILLIAWSIVVLPRPQGRTPTRAAA